MSAAEVWAVAGLVLGAAELLAPGVFLLWIGLAALGAGAATAVLGLGWHWQVAIFIAFAVVLIAVAAKRLRRRPDLVNAPSAGLVGATCTAIDFQGREGRVHLRDGTWSARMAGGETPTPGSALQVVGLEGNTLLVQALPM